MKTTIRTTLLSLTASALGAALPAYAHHSFPAQYDASKPIPLVATGQRMFAGSSGGTSAAESR